MMHILKDYILKANATVISADGKLLLAKGKTYLVADVAEDGTPMIVPEYAKKGDYHPIYEIEDKLDFIAIYMHAGSLGSIKNAEGFVQEPSAGATVEGIFPLTSEVLH